MNVLVVGNGGREHALAWKISQSSGVGRIFVAPGNAGTAEDAENVDIKSDDFQSLIRFAKENNVELTVVGPEAPLCAGITDAFQDAKLRVFGPSKAAAQLEGQQGLLQERCYTPPTCRPPITKSSAIPMTATRYITRAVSGRRASRSRRRQSRRSGGRQGSDRLLEARTGAGSDRPRGSRPGVWRRRQATRLSKSGSTVRKRVSWRSPTAAPSSRCRRLKTTSRLWMAIKVRIRAVWEPTALPR